LNEEALWELLAAHGYERVAMESLTFGEQVALMKEAAVIFSTHGAGLTNILFAHPDTHVVEISDPDFPSPLYYALACALGQPYWLLHAMAAGEGEGGYKDLCVDLSQVQRIVAAVEHALS
jgi:capsular polysaccharide biosynthesis protein